MAKKYVKISKRDYEKVQNILMRADYIAEKFIIVNDARDVLLGLISDASNVLCNAEIKKR